MRDQRRPTTPPPVPPPPSEAEPAPYVAKPADEDAPYVEVMPLSEWPGGEWRQVTREQADKMGIDWAAGRVPVTRRTDPEPPVDTNRAPEDYPLPDSRIDPEADGTEPEPTVSSGDGNVERTAPLVDPRLTVEQGARVAALREARFVVSRTVGPAGMFASQADVDALHRTAEYILNGLPPRAWPSGVLVPDGRPRRWALAALVTAVAAVVVAAAALVLVLG